MANRQLWLQVSQPYALRRGDRVQDRDADAGGDLSRHQGQARTRPCSSFRIPEIPVTARMPRNSEARAPVLMPGGVRVPDLIQAPD